jgi:hypothetical protein
MAGFAGLYAHAPGDQFIFRGGVIWPSNCFGVSGTNIGSGCWPKEGGSPGNSDYYGVRSNWFSGNSFVRPIFDGGHTNTSIFVIWYPVHCINFNSLDMRAIMVTGPIGQGVVTCINTDNITATNCHLHDWTMWTNAPGYDGNHGGWFNGYSDVYGITNMILDHCEIDNLDQAGAGGQMNGNCVYNGGVMNYCSLHDAPNGIQYGQDFNHGAIYNINYPTPSYQEQSQPYHANAFYMDHSNGDADGGAIPMFVRNSYIHDYNAVNILVAEVSDCYCYNNVIYGVCGANGLINPDTASYTPPNSGYLKSVYIYNNTLVVYLTNWAAVDTGTRGDGNYVNNLFITNNLVIGYGASLYHGGTESDYGHFAAGNNIVLNGDVAAAQGYTLSNLYAPISATNVTVGAGANLASLGLFTNAISGIARPAAWPWDIGAYQFSSLPAWGANLHVVPNP